MHSFIAREHYAWSPGLAQIVTPEAARAHFDETCDQLADAIREWMEGQ